MSAGGGWIGVDLDGTLAHYDGWKGAEHIGAPIPAMVERVQRWLAEGRDVRVFTARVAESDLVQRGVVLAVIAAWCLKHLGRVLLWDDRAVQVRQNTGEIVGESTRGLA